MKSLNKITLIGNVGAAPIIKTLPSGTKVANFSVATDESYKDKSGTWQNITTWHDIVAYSKLADLVEKYIPKGTRLYLEGKHVVKSKDKVNYHSFLLDQFLILDAKSKEVEKAQAEFSASDLAPIDGDDLPF